MPRTLPEIQHVVTQFMLTAFGVPARSAAQWVGQDVCRTAPVLARRYANEEARVTFDHFTPRVEPAIWEEIGPFVRDVALTTAPMTAYTAHRLAVTLTGYVFWTCHLRGLPLDAAVVFRRSNIHRYIAAQQDGHLSEGTLRNYRSMLYRVQEVVAPDPIAPLSPALNERTGIRPYSPEDVRRIEWWTTGQNTENKVRNALTMTALCMGAGLRAREVSDLVAGDIVSDDTGVLIRTAGRDVPVLAKWEQSLRYVVEPLAPTALVFGPADRVTKRNVLSVFVYTTSGSIRPRSDRTRATWIVEHLRARTDIRALMRAAGYQSSRTSPPTPSSFRNSTPSNIVLPFGWVPDDPQFQ